MWQDVIIGYVEVLKAQLPVPGFAFFGALLEEIVSPIPSSAVQIGVGGLAQNQAYPWYAVIALGAIGALGNTLGAILQYGLYRLIGKWIVSKIGVRIGITSEKIEAARIFLQKGARDDVAIFFLRALPFVPILNPSVISGILAIKFSTFAISTYLGYLVRNSYMLAVGFVGVDAIKSGDPRAVGLLLVTILIGSVIVVVTKLRAKHAKEPDQTVDSA